MSELPLNPPVLLLVIGIPGSGKTHFARQLSEQYSLPYISENRIRYELFEDSQFTNDENTIVNNIANMFIENLLDAKSSFIYEGHINKTRRLQIAKNATKKGFKTVVIWIQSDVQSASARTQRRDRRRPDDKYSQAITPEIFQKLSKQFTAPDKREESVVVSGKYAYKSQHLAVMRKLMHIYGGDTLTAAARDRRAAQYPIRRIIQ